MSEPSLLEELGLDEETLTWRQLSLCGGRSSGGGLPLSWFFETYENDVEHAKSMDEMCLRCPVIKNCLMEAAENKDSGLRGGIYLDKGRPDRQHNEHKTEEIWQRIRSKMAQ